MKSSLNFVTNIKSINLKNFYFFCSVKNDFLIAKKKKIFTLPDLDSTQKKKFETTKNNILSSLLKSNSKNNVFLSSPLGCNNESQSDFFFGLENLFKLYFFLKNNSDKNIFFTDPGWFLIAKRYLKNQKISFDYKNKDLIQANLYFFFNKFWKIYNIYNCLRYMNNLCIPTNKVIKKKFANIDIIFFSIWQNDTINKFSRTRNDPFFSNLPSILKSSGKSTAIFCHINNINKKNIDEFIKIKSDDVYSYFSILGYREIIKILYKLVSNNIKISSKFNIFKEMILFDLQKNIWTQSCEALLINECILKFISKNKNIKILHTYEGNCWEKGCYINIPKSTNIFGYQHTAFSLNQYKLSNIHPLSPKSIITTGKKAKEILSKNFFHNSEKIYSGYNLRNKNIYAYSPKTHLPKKISKILILLQGDILDQVLLEELKNIKDNGNFKILIRRHPLSNLNFSENNPKFLFSKKKNIFEDIKSSDIALFHKTTAAFESIFLGTPVLFFDIRNCKEDNPLINLKKNIMMNEINKKTTFEEVFKKLQKNRDNFKHDLIVARKYYKDFFSPRTKIKENQVINLINS